MHISFHPLTFVIVCRVSQKYSDKRLGEVGHIIRIENRIAIHDRKRQGTPVSGIMHHSAEGKEVFFSVVGKPAYEQHATVYGRSASRHARAYFME